jgi:hypothetical protein
MLHRSMGDGVPGEILEGASQAAIPEDDAPSTPLHMNEKIVTHRPGGLERVVR